MYKLNSLEQLLSLLSRTLQYGLGNVAPVLPIYSYWDIIVDKIIQSVLFAAVQMETLLKITEVLIRIGRTHSPIEVLVEHVRPRVREACTWLITACRSFLFNSQIILRHIRCLSF